jgi:histone acetyltransferase (RNA polymerase elongator complex component)
VNNEPINLGFRKKRVQEVKIMYEQGPIRPPGEGASLLVRVTRNCPWNRCLFCPAYKGEKFSRRTVEEVKKDIDAMARMGGPFTTAFLQDADSLILPTEDLIRIMEHIRARFPRIERITTYARAKSMKKKSVEAFRALRAAGLSRIHTGMESGSEAVLKMVRKGSHPDEMIRGGQKVKEAGISLSEYIMPGLGGKTLSREHALETARLLNSIKPDFIRVRTFAMPPTSPMNRMKDEGTFVPMADDEIVAEIRLLLSALDEMKSHFRCNDFSLNLLMHIDGRLDEHKHDMIEELDRFLALSTKQKRAYSLLQRSGYYFNRPEDMVCDESLVERASVKIRDLESGEKDGFNKYIQHLMTYQLPQPPAEDWN